MNPTVKILGCGSSGGVPRVALGWGACDPAEPRNRRRRCSILVERTGPNGVTRVLVDTSPDLREQLVEADVRHLDAVLMTHDHADHTHGIDDLRGLAMYQRRRVAVFADDDTAAVLRQRFGYCFDTPPGSDYPPILDMNRIVPGITLTVAGQGGDVTALPVRLPHGTTFALGLRFGGIMYSPDLSAIPQTAEHAFRDLDLWIVDALRPASHPSHFSLSDALAAIARFRPKRAVLTNLHTDLDYRALAAELPDGVVPAFDGMVLRDGSLP